VLFINSQILVTLDFSRHYQCPITYIEPLRNFENWRSLPYTNTIG
jgi:hypothetical protein